MTGQRILEPFDPGLPQGMSSSERAERYHDDSVRLLAEKNHGKIVAEVKKLRQWLQKHQDERLTDGAKTKLFAAIQAYFKAGQAAKEISEVTQGLVEDLLKMPEGKLVSAKAKKSALKWLGGGGGGDDGNTGGSATAASVRMLLVDMDGDTASVMPLRGGDVVDGLEVAADCLGDVSSRFANGGDDEVEVMVSRGRIVSLCSAE